MTRWLPLVLLACTSGKDAVGDTSIDGGPGPMTGTGTGTGSTATGTGTGTATGSGTGTGTGTLPFTCAPLGVPAGWTQVVIPSGDVSALVSAVNNAVSQTAILLEDGTYDLNGEYLWLDVSQVAVMGQNGDSALVTLDGSYATTEIVTILADDVIVAHLTTARAYTHGIHATGGDADVSGAVIYDVRVTDPGEQAIKVNQSGTGTWTDEGIIACSHLELTDAGRPNIRNNCYTGGIDMHATRGWEIRDNHIQGFWCDSGLSEHGIHLWRKNAESRIERNTIVDCARGIGLGLVETPGSFDRDHGIDCGPLYVDDIRGTVANNTIYASDPDLFASLSGFDSGIGVYAACQAVVAHNTVWSTDVPFSSIEWRFDATSAEIRNNLASHNLRERTPYIATVEGNFEYADAAWFVDANGGDLHVVSGADPVDTSVATGDPAIDQGFDHEGDLRTDGSPDAGADEL